MDNHSADEKSGAEESSGRAFSRPARKVQAEGPILFKLAGAVDYASDFGVDPAAVKKALRTGDLAGGYVEDMDEWIIDSEHLRAWVMKQSL